MAWGGGGSNNVELWVKRLRDNDPSFTSLHILSFRRVTPGELGHIFEALQHNEHLKELYASGHALDPSSASALAESLKHNKTLERLNIGHDHFGVDKTLVERVCQGLALNKGLKRLDLENKGFGGPQGTIEILAKALESPDCHLEELVLARNHMTDDDVRVLCTSLTKNECLQKLDLSLNEFGQAGTEAIAQLLAGQDGAVCNGDTSSTSHGGKLIEIDLSDNEITEQGGRAIGEALATNKVLRRLRMSSVIEPPLPVEEDEKVDNPLPRDQTLEELAQPLTEAEIQEIKSEGDAILEAIAASLRTNQTLQELWMDYCDLTPVSIQALAEALRTNASLTTLRLRNNRVGNRGARSLGAAMTKTSGADGYNSTLTALELGANKIGQPGWQGLAGACSLESLGLYDNTVHSLHEALENHQQQSQVSSSAEVASSTAIVNGTSGSPSSSMALSQLLHLDVGCNEISCEAFTSFGASLIKGLLPALIRLEIAGNGDRSEVEHGHGGDRSPDDFPETVREEEHNWARVVERIREARPELQIHWRVSTGQPGGREY
ncbi:hypothetical protein BGW41_000770 [Actinomortierella wolfii]|nr:hypothetical protein BGW41_000770 [Actinomortierella wolfii]